MSIFDKPRPTLNPVIFNTSGPAKEQLRPEVKSHLLALLDQTLFPFSKVYSLVLIGSNVTHQYDDASDIDVQVMAIPGESFDYWHKKFKAQNHRPDLLPGTNHPINYFFMEYSKPDTSGEAWKNSLGAYDVIKDTWLKYPMSFEEVGNPSDTYAKEIAYVNLVMKMVESEVNAIRQAVQIKDHDKALQSLKTLQAFFKRIEEDRKDSFRWGGGAPTLQEHNLIYKLIEHGEYGDLLKDLISG